MKQHKEHMLVTDLNYQCDVCMFGDTITLMRHKATDHGTMYKCELCLEVEGSESTSIGYLCCVCDAEFEVASSLKEHILTHDD